jgi:hypothetical protein
MIPINKVVAGTWGYNFGTELQINPKLRVSLANP